jgi:hypothetical protein
VATSTSTTPSRQWKRTSDDDDVASDVPGGTWYYARRVTDDGVRVILELHLDAGEQHATAAIHAYTEPDDHVTDDLAGCKIRGSLPGREHYDTWLLADRSDDHAFGLLAEVDVPALVPGIPSHAADRIAELEAEVAMLRAQASGRPMQHALGRTQLPAPARRSPHMRPPPAP